MDLVLTTNELSPAWKSVKEQEEILSTVPVEIGSAFRPLIYSPDIPTSITAFEEALTSHFEANNIDNACEGYDCRHMFAPGVYIRELTIPAGHLLVGKLHKQEHFNFISKGKVTVFTEQGGMETLVAPCTMISKIGTKRVLYTHEETVWSVVHPTTLTDVDEIESEVIAKTYEDLKTLTVKE